jgi:hypothetical protein
VSIPEKVSGDIRSLQRAIAGTLEKLGCGACCSGFDITFRRELDGLLIDDNLDVRGLGSFR